MAFMGSADKSRVEAGQGRFDSGVEGLKEHGNLGVVRERFKSHRISPFADAGTDEVVTDVE